MGANKDSELTKKIKIKTESIHYLNYWVLGIFFALRCLDYLFTYIAISSGHGSEVNPIGFNIILIIIGFIPVVVFLIVNYKLPDIRIVMYFNFFVILMLIIIQTVATLNAAYGVIVIMTY